ncbi:EAL domain-containing protein [Virgibacillus salexigens]|uniref:Cyclic di-GMP phosphodiesterase Gmr n=1 Tax=Virgibacillus massiliensis TaxID=1462526 RepID=A0A024QE96_9BACI|nr:EAL domain-containing protein [Virgibacillus massiliensis]CDQ40291.1 Cyclic di-GMP phosphodiesterase Gmr [Virgibacillus massiliensis]
MKEQNQLLPIPHRILENLKEPILITDKSGTFIAGNAAAYSTLEIECAEPGNIKQYLAISMQEISKEFHQLVELQRNANTLIEVKVIEAKYNYFCFLLNNLTINGALQELKYSFSNGINHDLEGIILYEVNNGTIIDYDSPFASMFHYAPQELLGMNIRSIFHKDSVHLLYDHVHKHPEKPFLLTGLKKGGAPFYVEAYGHPCEYQGRIIRICLIKDITNQELNKKRVEYLSYFDAQTDLPNRNYLFQVLKHTIAHAKEQEKGIAILSINMNYDKERYHTLGYAFDQKFTRTCADRLTAYVQEHTFIAYINEKDFVLLHSGLNNRREMEVYVEKLINHLKTPAYIDNQEVNVNVHIGISVFPEHGEQENDLLKHADSAMYISRSTYFSEYTFFQPAFHLHFKSILTLEHQLKRAMQTNQLQLYYQPQTAFMNNQVIGMEALLRWKHPKRGMILPLEFIAIAERSGLIIDIGDWVIYEACRQNKHWQDKGFNPIVMSVNLSPIQFYQRNFVTKVRRILTETNLNPCYLELEITETMAMQIEEVSLQIIEELRNLGVSISIDDFGTGYSSLKSLCLYPITKLKIDKMFMRNEYKGNQMIVRSIIKLSHSLDMKVIAEGVETKEQFTFLQKEECDAFQGFYISAPLPPEELTGYFIK